jgi:hypothetical protein
VLNVAQRMVAGGVAGSGANVSGESVVPYGLAASPQSANAVVMTCPANALFLDAVIVTRLSRFSMVLIVTVPGTVKAKSGISMTVPE